jgi:hypothetical protein
MTILFLMASCMMTPNSLIGSYKSQPSTDFHTFPMTDSHSREPIPSSGSEVARPVNQLVWVHRIC